MRILIPPLVAYISSLCALAPSRLGFFFALDVYMTRRTQRPICLNCGEFAFFELSCCFGSLSFALAPIQLLPDYTVCALYRTRGPAGLIPPSIIPYTTSTILSSSTHCVFVAVLWLVKIYLPSQRSLQKA